MARILVIEADEASRQALLLALHGAGADAAALDPGSDVARAVEQQRPDAIVAGGGAAGVSGVGAGAAAAAAGKASSNGHAGNAGVPVVALVDGDAEGLLAIRAGAADFVRRDQGPAAVLLACEKLRLRRLAVISPGVGAGPAAAPVPSPPAGKTGAAAPDTVDARALGFVGDSAAMRAVVSSIKRLARVRTTVLVGGESGTGKELVARALHSLSPWHQAPFVAVNCGAIPAGLIESELFGHARGAFTDAVRDKLGLFEQADGGTLFLDEIGDLPLPLQTKLLRVLQEGEVRPVGGVEDRHVEVRVVAATARVLEDDVKARRFREDLYYRLAGPSVSLPPLRARPGDIPLLARHFLDRARARHRLPVTGIDPNAMRALVAYGWPGNVRELENTIDRAAVLCDGSEIDLASLPERIAVLGRDDDAPGPFGVGGNDGGAGGAGGADDASDDLSIKHASRRVEDHLIRRALRATGGNRTRAAELLEISHRALLYKMKEYGITGPSRGGDDEGRTERTATKRDSDDTTR